MGHPPHTPHTHTQAALFDSAESIALPRRSPSWTRTVSSNARGHYINIKLTRRRHGGQHTRRRTRSYHIHRSCAQIGISRGTIINIKAWVGCAWATYLDQLRLEPLDFSGCELALPRGTGPGNIAIVIAPERGVLH